MISDWEQSHSILINIVNITIVNITIVNITIVNISYLNTCMQVKNTHLAKPSYVLKLIKTK